MATKIEHDIRDYLIKKATKGDLATYEEIAIRFKLPSTGSQLGLVLSPILGSIAAWCMANRLPHLTALVVRKSGADAGLPGQGFWDLLNMQDFARPQKETAHRVMLRDIYQLWAM